MSDQRSGDDPGTSIRPAGGPPGQSPGQRPVTPPQQQPRPAPQQTGQQPTGQQHPGQHAQGLPPGPHPGQYPQARPAPPGPPPGQQPWGAAYPPPQPAPPSRPARERSRRGVGGVGLLAGALVLGALAGFGGAALYGESSDPLNGKVDPASIDTEGLDPLDLVSVQSVATAALPTVVKIEAVGDGSGSTGSGVVISDDGEILTNYHVVHAGQDGTIRVFFDDGSTADASVVGADPDLDIALIRAEGVSDLATASFGDSREASVGQAVVAVGSPYGLDATVTAGIISTLNRPVAVPGLDDPDVPMIYPALQTDAAINPGNSGGALVNVQGELIGINSANKLAASADPYGNADLGSIGIGWAIPIHVIEPILEQLRAGETPTHAWLGITPGDATEAGLAQGGLVEGFEADSAAEDAGVEEGDVVTAIDEWQVADGLGLVTTTLEYRPGDEVTLTVLRDGEEQEVPVTMGEKQGLFD